MKFLLLFVLILSVACSHPKNINKLEIALASENEAIRMVMDSLEPYEVQILFTDVIRDSNNQITFKDFEFQVNDSNYFYPASTVKLPITLLALEKLNEDERFDRDSNFFVEGDSVTTTFADEITKIFSVSDNEANNRLFEYLGQDGITNRLNDKGINSRISHRLSALDSEELTTKPLIFYVNDSTTTPTIPIINKPLKPLTIKMLSKGTGYIDEDEFVEKPMDFSFKNYLPITSLHNIMKQLMFPEIYSEEKQFHLTESDSNFLINLMKIDLRGESNYDDNTIEIYTKVGYAYGYLTDCAYIKNKKTKKEYIMTATIHTNKNGVYNDDVYETKTVGIPFLSELRRQLIVE